MKLLIDIGNTNIHAAVVQHAEILHSWRIATKPIRTADEYHTLLLAMLARDDVRKEDISAITLASVVPSITDAFRSLSDVFNVDVKVIDHNTKLPITIALDSPKEVGADRILNAVAAKQHVPDAACIILDFGTATTLDVVTKDGAYIGGMIAPGPELSLKALHQHAEKLPIVEIEKPANVIGSNTRDAMRSGLFYGYMGLIRESISQIQAELDAPAKVLATGGLASLFAPYIKQIDAHHPNLTLEGLMALW